MRPTWQKENGELRAHLTDGPVTTKVMALSRLGVGRKDYLVRISFAESPDLRGGSLVPPTVGLNGETLAGGAVEFRTTTPYSIVILEVVPLG